MITERYTTYSALTDEEKELLIKGYEQYFNNNDYFDINADMNIIIYEYHTFKVFFTYNADIIVAHGNEIINTLFSSEIVEFKIDNYKNILAFLCKEHDFLLIDFIERKIYNSKEIL